MKIPSTLFLFMLLFFAISGISQSVEDCMVCHEDESLTMEKRGKEISLFVSAESFQKSPHGNLDCVSCHSGFNADEIPHKEPIEPVNCADCHDEVQSNFQHSKHAGALDCSSCHKNAHAPQSSASLKNQCNSCHSDEKNELAKSVHSESVGLECLDCHSPHTVGTAGFENCLSCHSQQEKIIKTEAGDTTKKEVHFDLGAHAEILECGECHSPHGIVSANSPESAVNRQNILETCGTCHDDLVHEFLESEHGNVFKAGVESAPVCSDCHSEHQLPRVVNHRSPESLAKQIETCMDCHLNSPEVKERMTHTSAFIASYEMSIHGRALHAGNTEAAICSDCHDSHKVNKASDPNSKVNKFHITETCGTCHGDVTHTFNESIHGEALIKRVKDAPTCTDCHGEHQIIEPGRKDSPVAPVNVSQEVCAPCHSSVKLNEKYGLPSNRYDSYLDSYHGLANRFGAVEAANCASCHGVHDILPSSDPRSKVHKANLAETCGSCHPGANENFAVGKVHITRDPEGDKLIYWISNLYIILIVVLVGSMTLHNLLDWFRKSLNRYHKEYKVAYHPPKERKSRLYLRMTLNERIQHFLLLTSFFTLVVTGFMLKFPEAWWVDWLRQWGGETLFNLRSLTHRVAGVIMMGVSLYHIYYMVATARGREFVRDIMFRYQDLKDMAQMLRYNLGLSKVKPKFGRFNYIEKSEYWALVWGTIIMSLTGIALWFENQFMGWFSKLFVDVAETVHYFEAWLAFLAILVWHIYYVIFNPDSYPMNFAWITGKITEEEMEAEHPLELEKIKEAELKEETEENEPEHEDTTGKN